MSQTDNMEDSTAPLIEHLTELRTRLIRSVLAFLVGIILAFTVAEPILQFLLVPIKETLMDLGDTAPTLQYTSPQEYLFTLFRISMVFGFALVLSGDRVPAVALSWRRACIGQEKNAFLPFLVASPLMFILGASFAHFVVTPLAMAFFPWGLRTCRRSLPGCRTPSWQPRSRAKWGCSSRSRRYLRQTSEVHAHHLLWQGQREP